MTQEKKAIISAKLKGIVPKDWKYSLSVRHHSTIVMTIKSAPKAILNKPLRNGDGAYEQINDWHINDKSIVEEYHDIIVAIMEALNTDNHNNSDSQSDYFDVGHYVDLNVGKWDKPFEIA